MKDAIEAPTDDVEGVNGEGAEEQSVTSAEKSEVVSPAAAEKIKANDIAIIEDGSVTDGLVRFHTALSEMTHRRGIRNEISRYEAIALALVEPKGEHPGSIFEKFPSHASPLHHSQFFHTLYRRYDERFRAWRALTRRSRDYYSPMVAIIPSDLRSRLDSSAWPKLDFDARVSAT